MSNPAVPPEDTAQKNLEKLEALTRLRDLAAQNDRPAIHHACKLLLKLELEKFRPIATAAGPVAPIDVPKL